MILEFDTAATDSTYYVEIPDEREAEPAPYREPPPIARRLDPRPSRSSPNHYLALTGYWCAEIGRRRA
jgi:hypothetical protein